MQRPGLSTIPVFRHFSSNINLGISVFRDRKCQTSTQRKMCREHMELTVAHRHTESRPEPSQRCDIPSGFLFGRSAAYGHKQDVFWGANARVPGRVGCGSLARTRAPRQPVGQASTAMSADRACLARDQQEVRPVGSRERVLHSHRNHPRYDAGLALPTDPRGARELDRSTGLERRHGAAPPGVLPDAVGLCEIVTRARATP